MSQGELLQIQKSRKLDITEEVYFKIINQKTASLIAACCAIGAKSVNSSSSIVSEFYKIALILNDFLCSFSLRMTS